MDGKQEFFEAQKLLMKGEYKSSIEAFENALKSGSEPVITNLSIGVAQLKIEAFEDALKSFDKAVNLNTQSPRAFYYRGMARMILKEFDLAIEDFSNALRLKPDLATALFARGTAYAQIDKYEESSADIKATIPYMEANAQSFNDTYGLIQTHFDKVMAYVSGEGKMQSINLTDSEKKSLQKFVEEGGGNRE